MPWKLQPIRVKESRCLPIVRRSYVTLIVLATVFSLAWYNIVMQRSLVVYHGIPHLSLNFLGIYTGLKARVDTENNTQKRCIAIVFIQA